MEHIINQIHKLLLEKQKTVAAAESCTGGLLSRLLTDIPGSSQYFTLGVVAYSNKAKEAVLKIPCSLIAKEGAASQRVALEMARSVRKIAKADIGIGVTGIAGPTGGSTQKPVGTVFIAIAGKNSMLCKKLHFSGRRAAVRKKSALKALELLYENLYRN